MGIEFSLKGLAELLEKNGFRVVAGNEGKNSFIERLDGHSKMIYRVEKIDLTVTLERPVPESGSGSGHPTVSQGELDEEIKDLGRRLEEGRPYGTD
jgi:hypothetical protein